MDQLKFALRRGAAPTGSAPARQNAGVPPSPSLRFGRFELRLSQRLLLRDGRACPLGGRAFDVLQMLLECHERVVSRDEILDAVWPGLAVEPNNLQVQIWTLRRLLGRDAIVTIPRRGYRYVGPPPEAASTGRAMPGRRPDACPVATAVAERSRLRWVSRSS